MRTKMFKGLYKYKATTYNTIRYCIYTLIKKVNCGHWLRSASLGFMGTTEHDRRSICSWQKDWRQVCFTCQRPLKSLVGLDHHYDSLLWKLWKLGKNEFLGALLITFWEQGINFKLLRAKFNDPLTPGGSHFGQSKTRSVQNTDCGLGTNMD